MLVRRGVASVVSSPLFYDDSLLGHYEPGARQKRPVQGTKSERYGNFANAIVFSEVQISVCGCRFMYALPDEFVRSSNCFFVYSVSDMCYPVVCKI